jgi:hypothetical protein
MKTVFADACYWIALVNPNDILHDKALEVSQSLGQYRTVTSEMILVELLNGLSGFGETLRSAAVAIAGKLAEDPNVEIVPQTSLQFRSAMERYASRSDKEWGVTDCASFLIMEERKLLEALTKDKHFAQARFKILMNENP